jgi:hypothetical protein
MLEYLKALEQLGLLTNLYKHGIINPAVKNDYELYLQVQAQMGINGDKKRQAVITVSDKLGITEDTIYKALRRLKK